MAAPTLFATPPSVSAGVTTAGTAGTPQSYVLTGSNFTANLAVTAPTGIEISQTGAGGTYATTQVLAPSGGNINATIHMRIAASAAVGSINADITHTSTNLTTLNVNVTGTVNSPPTITVPAGTLALGSTTVLCRRFDTERVAQRLVLHQVRTLVVVPVMLQRLLDIPAVRQFRYSFRHVSTVISAGSPLGAALAARWMDTHGDNLFNLYGSTEAGGVALATPEDLRAAPGTVGRMPLGAEVRILDSMGCALPAGLPGHICVRSGMLFEGYVGGGGKPMINGYMNTGDIGYLDAEGRLFVEGREDDMIVSGGENVFPLEVEEWLAAYPGVAEVAVVGVTDAEFGQRLKAFVVEAEGAGLCAGVLKAFLRDRIARYKVPRDIVLVDALPRNAGGQVLRRQLATR